MDHNAKKVIFIGGSSYSGSTMLDMMLANSPEGFSAGEVHALFHPYRPHHFNPECGCGNPDCDFWLKVRDAGEAHLYESIFNLLPDVKFIVDSSKNPWWIKKQDKILERKGIEVHHLLIWKEPASFAHSMLKRKRKGWEKAWKNYYRLYLTLCDHYISVAYSNLVQFPEQVLTELCSKCGLAYHEGMEKFWQKQHHTLFGNESAKIHLAENGVNSSGCHRSIYIENNHAKSITDPDRRMIERNPTIRDIIEVLEGYAEASHSNSTKLTPGQMAATELRHKIKAMAGRATGRHARLF